MHNWWEGFGSSSLATLPLGFNCDFISISVGGSSTRVCFRGCPGGPGFAPVRPGVEVMQLLGSTQRGWRLGQQGIWCSRRVWPPVLANNLQYSCLENLPDRGAWQATVYRVTKSRTRRKQPCAHRHKTFLACGSSAPARIERECGAAAWLARTLAAPIVQGHRLPLLQGLWPCQSFLSLL